MVVKKNKPPEYFSPTRTLVRWINPEYISKRTPRISPTAFERKRSSGKIEKYLSVNCKDMESFDNIVNYFELQFGVSKNSLIHYVSHKIEKINQIADKCKASSVSYNRSLRSYCYVDPKGDSRPAYEHYPKQKAPEVHESYSHSGIMFLEGLTETEEKSWSLQLACNSTPQNRRK